MGGEQDEGTAEEGFEGREERVDGGGGVAVVFVPALDLAAAVEVEVVMVRGSDRFDTVKLSSVFAIAKTSSPCACAFTTCTSFLSPASAVPNLSNCCLTPSTSASASTSITPTFCSLLPTICPLGTVGSSFPVVATSISLCKNHPVVPPSASTSHSLIPADIDEECLNRVHRGPAQDRISVDFLSIDLLVILFAVVGGRIVGVRISFAGEVW